jgi:2-keto-4-pentenoate hydratase/2-oxohepta-3-ene-1,7-dioic acid hydratase in catechol pathway
MKICKFTTPKAEHFQFGVINGSFVSPLLNTEIYTSELKASDENFPTSTVKLLLPVAPSKIVCVGRNYADHAAELGNEVPKEPLLFLKAPSSLITNGESIMLPPQSNQVEHEGELAIVIGRTAKNIAENEDPLEYVFGYTCLNDVTARDLQRKDVQFSRAKSFDTFCPIGDFVETQLDLTNLKITVRVNDEIKQHSNTAQMVFSVPFLIRYVSNQMTLFPGDIIATGTPSGVSKLNPGDVCSVEIESVGILSNPVAQ